MSTLTFPEFFFRVNDKIGKEKLTLGPIEVGKHLTLHFGTKSGVFDIHIKDEKSGTYETLIEIKHSSLFEAYLKIENRLEEICLPYFSKFIKVGKLKKYNCILQPLIINEQLENVLYLKKNTVKFRKNVSIDDIEKLFLIPDNTLMDIECEIFTVYRVKKGFPVNNGTIFRIPNKPNSKRFIYISRKRLKMLASDLLQNMTNALDIDSKEKIKKLIDYKPYVG